MTANIKDKYVPIIDKFLKETNYRALPASWVYDGLIAMSHITPDMFDLIFKQYSLYIAKWNYDFHGVESKYVSAAKKLVDITTFCKNKMYMGDFKFDDARSKYLLGNMTLTELKEKCQQVEAKIKHDKG